MTASQSLVTRLVDEFPELAPIMEEHLEDQEGELLPYLLMADVAQWSHDRYGPDPELVGRVVDCSSTSSPHHHLPRRT